MLTFCFVQNMSCKTFCGFFVCFFFIKTLFLQKNVKQMVKHWILPLVISLVLAVINYFGGTYIPKKKNSKNGNIKRVVKEKFVEQFLISDKYP